MIRAPLCGIAFALLPGAVSAAPLADADFLAAFAVACLDGYRDPVARAAAIEAAGWRPVADDADPMLARMLAISRQSLKEAEHEDGYEGSAAVAERYRQRHGIPEAHVLTLEVEQADQIPRDAFVRQIEQPV